MLLQNCLLMQLLVDLNYPLTYGRVVALQLYYIIARRQLAAIKISMVQTCIYSAQLLADQFLAKGIPDFQCNVFAFENVVLDQHPVVKRIRLNHYGCNVVYGSADTRAYCRYRCRGWI